ncbi:MAG TPA: alpha/beta hydrolase [Gemmatirosa sp.]|nr:alpha/beta hydrolase [Gemmatirosa sp.]
MATRLAHDVRATGAVAHGRRLELAFGHDGDAARVPGVLLLPPEGAPPAPAAVLLHGFSSRKEQMADGVGSVLLAHGIASLSIDLPLHGERIAEGQATSWGLAGGYERAVDRTAMQNPLALAGAWRTAQRDARLALAYLGARREVDRARLAVVGYSMGSFLGVQVAADERAVRALVLAAGGDLPDGMPYATALRLVADPRRAVKRFDGRPLLMVHGRRDPTVRPEQAQRLFDAAMEPKELRWYDAGHYLPQRALDEAADWLVERLGG